MSCMMLSDDLHLQSNLGSCNAKPCNDKGNLGSWTAKRQDSDNYRTAFTYGVLTHGAELVGYVRFDSQCLKLTSQTPPPLKVYDKGLCIHT